MGDKGSLADTCTFMYLCLRLPSVGPAQPIESTARPPLPASPPKLLFD